MFTLRHEPAYTLLPSEEHIEKRKSKARRVLIGVIIAGFLALAATTAVVLRPSAVSTIGKTTANSHGVEDPRLEVCVTFQCLPYSKFPTCRSIRHL